MKRRLIHFAGSTIAIEYNQARAERILDYLYQDIPAESQDEPHLTFQLLVEGENGELRLYAGEVLERRTESDEEMAAYLLDRTCYHLADRSHGGLVLHSAGLTWRGRGLLMPGQTGRGKSTLSAWLLTQGFDYLTDELVFVPLGTNQFQGLTRPLNLKQAARELLKEMLNNQETPPEVMSSHTREITPPRALRGGQVQDTATLSLMIFPHFQEGSDFQLREISKAQAGLALMQCLINARNLEEHGFPEVTRLVRTTPAYEMVYGGFDQIGGAIGDLIKALD